MVTVIHQTIIPIVYSCIYVYTNVTKESNSVNKSYNSLGLALGSEGFLLEFRHEFDIQRAGMYCQLLEGRIW